MYRVMRTNDEVDDVLITCLRLEESGESLLYDMTYEQGVEAGIKWVLGEVEEHPLGE